MRRTASSASGEIGAGSFAFGLAAGAGLDIGECEERPARMRPAGRLQDRARRATGLVELSVAAVGVGLQHPRPSGEV